MEEAIEATIEKLKEVSEITNTLKELEVRDKE